MLTPVLAEIARYANPQKARILQRFFKTGKGEYAQGDVFLGITVPIQRTIAKQYLSLQLGEVQKLLTSKIHEHRLIALLILIQQYNKGDEPTRKRIVTLYVSHTHHINNWDLVDLSAEHILGAYLFDKDRSPLIRLAYSQLLWDRRIAVLSTFNFIKRGDFSSTIQIAEILLKDSHDLIHKAAGWMLREIGKRGGLEEEECFLKRYAPLMPRTMLRYAIERFPEKKKRWYMTRRLISSPR